uniref:BTB domain-containing protein n=1 Tax=Macrostomum lignano TaxID=282301 RepID=A0A1I8JJZ2_9PLAT
MRKSLSSASKAQLVAAAMVSRATSVTLRQGSGCGQSRPPENRIIINVGGVRFETYKSTLQNIPDTRLAWLAEATSVNSADFDPDTGEYFFDRHSGVFAMILNYYRTGRLHTPMDICGPMFEEELAYWGIDEKQMESCCWTTYRTHRDAQETLAELNGGELSDDGEEDAPGDTARRFGIEEAAGPELGSGSGRGSGRCSRSRVPALAGPASLKTDHIKTDNLKTDHLRNDHIKTDHLKTPDLQALATVSVLFILASIIALVVETLPEARIPRPGAGAMNCSRLMVSDCLRYTQPRPAVHAVDITVTAYFALELAARLVFCPSKPEFFKSALNWIDLVAVATACVSFAVPPESAVIVHQILKVPRILRIFKLTRHFSGLKILVHTMKASSRELTLLGTVFAIFVILCGTAIFICEQFVESPVNEFRTIPIGFWWALVTMTTLGYGDMVPRTLPGYIVGASAPSAASWSSPCQCQSLSTTSPCTTRTPRPG